MPEKTICIIRATYEGAKFCVLHKNKLSQPFKVRSGVHQGCILSPLLFLIVLGDVLRKALKLQQASGIRRTTTSFPQHLDNANDIGIYKITELSAMVKSLDVVAVSASLAINCRKTKTLSLTRNDIDINFAYLKFTFSIGIIRQTSVVLLNSSKINVSYF